MYLDEKKVTFVSSYDAMKSGIAMVYQELSLTSGMSIAENIFMNRQPINAAGLIKKAQLNEDALRYIDMFRINADPETLISYLGGGEQQLVEIARAVSLQPKVLILDEPTSSLAGNSVELLFDIIGQLKEQGYAFIYISHKLDEIFRIADRVMIMRDGKEMGIKTIDEVNEQDLIRMMVGREIKNLYAASDVNPQMGDAYFGVQNLSAFGLFSNISFSLRRGAILGMAGLIGAGRTEVAAGIIGMAKVSSGTIFLEGEKLSIKKPSDAINAGIGYITEDRKKMGLFLDFTISANLISASLASFANSGFMVNNKITKFAEEQVRDFSIACIGINQTVGKLSGGNQQKCLLSMWMSKNPKVLIFDEPTRGVDVGAKSEIYEDIRNYVRQGVGALVISSDLSELIGLCDRILVMYNGMIHGEVNKGDFSDVAINSLCFGL